MATVDDAVLAQRALDARSHVAEMTPQEQTDLLTGFGMWKTARLERFGVEPTVMTDGTYGVRYSIQQIDGDERGGTDLDDFLAVVAQRASDVAVAFGQTKPSTCFPNGSAMGCSWDVSLLERLGVLLGRECRSMGVHTLLGPGINIRRTPLAGRSYEYYSEDPLLTGKLATAVINGIQSQGVGTSLKHFAGNNSEKERTTMDSVVDERALREIYLRGFEIAVKEGHPWTVMSSYNRLNGVQTAEDHWLLTEVLRDNWKFPGLVMSDWNGIKDRPASVAAGNDLDMPESPRRKADLLAAIESGALPAATVQKACVRVLDFIAQCFDAKVKVPKVEPFDVPAHHAEARRMAASSLVLLKNEGSVLPVGPSVKRILVVGRDAATPVIQGSGCATTFPTKVDQPLEELRAILGDKIELIHKEKATDETLALASSVDLVLVYTSTEGAWDGEGSDRTTLALGPGQDAAIEALANASKTPVAVVIACPDAVSMPWIDKVSAVLVTFYSGQAMGGAVADVVAGHVNPSGKLSVTFPQKLSDVPGYLSYPGENGRHLYSEGIHVGYRGYDKKECEPLFPFGFGLSYTTFQYSGLTLSAPAVGKAGKVDVSFTIENTGKVDGEEAAQIYLEATGKRLHRSPRELKGFTKVKLAPGESRQVTVTIRGSDLTVWDPEHNDWVLEDEEDAKIVVASSSRDLGLSAPLKLKPSAMSWPRVKMDTQPAYVLGNPVARPILQKELARLANISESNVDVVLKHCANSFIGIFPTLERRLRITVPDDRAQEVLDKVNAAMDEAERALPLV